MVGLREEVEKGQPFETEPLVREETQVPGQRGRVARDVDHPAGPEPGDCFEGLPGAGPGRVEDDQAGSPGLFRSQHFLDLPPDEPAPAEAVLLRIPPGAP